MSRERIKQMINKDPEHNRLFSVTVEDLVAKNDPIIAKIVFCGLPMVTVRKSNDWIKPTAKQAKALHDNMCIDILLYNKETDTFDKMVEDKS